MNTLTPPITDGSTVTPSFCFIAGTRAAVVAARRLISSFHSSAFFGSALKYGG